MGIVNNTKGINAEDSQGPLVISLFLYDISEMKRIFFFVFLFFFGSKKRLCHEFLNNILDFGSLQTFPTNEEAI